MNIRQCVILFSFFSGSTTLPILNRIANAQVKHSVTKTNASKKLTTLQKRFGSKKIDNCNGGDFIDALIGIPAGMIGSGAGLITGVIGGFTVGLPASVLLGDDVIESCQALGGGSGIVIGGLVASGTVGGIPGAVAWSTIATSLFIRGKFKKK